MAIIEVNVNGTPIYFEEAEQIDAETEKVGGFDVGKLATESYQKALDTVHALVTSTATYFHGLDSKDAPDEFELKFGIKLSGEYGAVITKIASEAQLEVSVKYKSWATKSS